MTFMMVNKAEDDLDKSLSMHRSFSGDVVPVLKYQSPRSAKNFSYVQNDWTKDNSPKESTAMFGLRRSPRSGTKVCVPSDDNVVQQNHLHATTRTDAAGDMMLLEVPKSALSHLLSKSDEMTGIADVNSKLRALGNHKVFPKPLQKGDKLAPPQAMHSIGTSTINSFLNRSSEPQAFHGSLNASRIYRKESLSDIILPQYSNLDNAAAKVEKPSPRISPHSRSQDLSEYAVVTSHKLKSPSTFQVQQRPMNPDKKTRAKGHLLAAHAAASTNHVNSIPNQNSRVVLDHNLTVVNSNSQKLKMSDSSGRIPRIVSAKSNAHHHHHPRKASSVHAHPQTTAVKKPHSIHGAVESLSKLSLNNKDLSRRMSARKRSGIKFVRDFSRKSSTDSGTASASLANGDDGIKLDLASRKSDQCEDMEFEYEEDYDNLSFGITENDSLMGATEFMDDTLNFIEDDIDEDDAASTSTCTSDDNKYVTKNTSSTAQPALIVSKFANCAPVINFCAKEEEVEQHRSEVRKLLKWKMSSITPIVVRNTVLRSGFRPTKKNHDWLGYFGKHMKSSGFRSVKDYQKVNHFPGSFQLGRKDRLWRNVSKMQSKFGRKEFGFLPHTFVLPWDRKLLKTAWDEGTSKQKYILKPPASARGIGIRVIHKWNQIPSKKPVIVQKYLSRPYLINGSKFDLRLYVYVTSFDPMRVYLFHDGLVRFATCKYSSSMKHLSNKYMHLTNYSINKKSGEFQQNDDVTLCQGHKWSMGALWGHLKEKGVDTEKIWREMKDVVIKTLISVEHFTNSLIKSNCRRTSCCHELFGFDVMLDDRMRPWVLEVNISPSLHSNSALDAEVKGQMVKDMFNIAGFQVPDKKQIAAQLDGSAPTFSQDKRKQSLEICSDSRLKHTYFVQHHKRMSESELTSFMLDKLTTNDIHMLVESEDELTRAGNFQRIFPSRNRKYLDFFEQSRYYNVLLHAWELRYKDEKMKAHMLLQSFCRKGLNVLQAETTPAANSEHVWNPLVKPMPSPRSGLRHQQLPVLGQHKSAGDFPAYNPAVMATALVAAAPTTSNAEMTAGDEHGHAAPTGTKLVMTSKSLMPVARHLHSSASVRSSPGCNS